MIDVQVKRAVRTVDRGRPVDRPESRTPVRSHRGLLEYSLVSDGVGPGPASLDVFALLAPRGGTRPREVGMFAREV